MRLRSDVNLQIILAIVSMAVMGGSLVAPLLPSMIEPLGASRETIGLVLSSFTLGVAVSTPLLGAVSDKVGRRKVLIPSIFLYGIAGVLIPLTTSFLAVLALRALQGLSAAAMVTLAITIIGDLYEGRARATAMCYRSSVHSTTFAVVPFAAGAIGLAGWFYPFFVFGLAVPLGFLTLWKLKVPDIHTDKNLREYLREIRGAIGNRKTEAVLFYNFLLFMVLYILVTFVPLLLAEAHGFSTFQIGLYIALFFLTSALISSQAERLMARFSASLLIFAGFLVSGLALLLLPLVPTAALVVPVLLLWAVGYGIAFPTLYTLAAEVAPPQLRAGIVSAVMMMAYLGATLTSPVFGAILNYSSLDTVFVCGGLTAVLPLLIHLLGHLRARAPHAGIRRP